MSVVVLGSTLHAELAKPADMVANTIGINTHFGVTSSLYGVNSDLTISFMRQMGVRHFRDGVAWLNTNAAFSSQSYALFNELGAYGIKGDYILNANMTNAQLQQTVGQLHNVEAIEYPNEYDVAGDANWIATLKSTGANLSADAKAYSIPLVGPSFVQMNSAKQLGVVPMDANNLHAYFNNYPPDLNYAIGSAPGANAGGGPCAEESTGEWVCYPGLKFLLNNVAADGPGKPVWITETGYQTSGTASTPGQGQYVPANYEPAYYVREVLWALNNGVPRLYFYSLLDDPGSTYGLIDGNLQPKPAYYALASLIHLMDDSGTASFQPGDLPYSLSGGDQYLMHALFQKSDGTFYLALWEAKSTWDGAKDITPAAESVNLFVSGHSILGTYTMQQNGLFNAASINKAQAMIAVGTSPIFVRIQ